MRILIVNGYSLNVASKQQFEDYQDAIKQIFMGQKELLDTETEFFVRDQTNLDEFLYEADSGFASRQAARQFDFIDLVFIQMESNLKPWSPFAMKMNMLIRMCLRTNKIMLGSSAAMQTIVFLVATNFEYPINILNGQNGSLLGDLSKIQKPFDKIKSNEYFLDNVTGDLYGIRFDKENNETSWQPMANCGIHQRKAAEEFKKIGQFMIKTPVYRSKPNFIEKIYVSRINEEICSIKKNQMHHWLLKGVALQQLVHSQHSWDVHAFNVVNPSKVFITLGESAKVYIYIIPQGPQIIQINENIIATQFYIDKKYDSSLIILKNFILYQLNRIRCGQSRPTPIIEANNFLRQKKLEVENLTQSDNTVSPESKDQFAKLKFHLLTKFYHAGYAAKKQSNLEVVVNNSIGTAQRTKNLQIELPQPSVRITKINTLLSSKGSNLYSQIKNQHEMVVSGKDSESFSEDRNTIYPFSKTQSEIRQMLHPQIKKEGVPASTQLWVPGKMSQQVQSGRNYAQIRPFTSSSQLTQSQKSLIRTQSAVNPKRSSYVQINQTSDSQPYISETDLNRREQFEKDKLIIGTRTIITNIDRRPTNLQNIKFSSPYNPTQTSQFTKPDKSKWVGTENFRSY